VRERIAAAAQAAGRRAEDVRLLAVSKTFGPDHVRAASAAGQREFGENKVQEALQKIADTADIPIGWHLIGHLQSNKARKAAGAFAAIHSIDFAGEETKFGAPEADVPAIAHAAVHCRAARLAGLMLLPPWFDDPEQARPYFQRLRALRDRLAAEGIDPALLGELSMGMSHDFEVAIQEGATLVRIGTAIFGKRTVRT
jgi:uncharacterized pyridoxal phosphate-containing UPF0001 family protein